jgi:hypothetical protein
VLEGDLLRPLVTGVRRQVPDVGECPSGEEVQTFLPRPPGPGRRVARKVKRVWPAPGGSALNTSWTTSRSVRDDPAFAPMYADEPDNGRRRPDAGVELVSYQRGGVRCRVDLPRLLVAKNAQGLVDRPACAG